MLFIFLGVLFVSILFGIPIVFGMAIANLVMLKIMDFPMVSYAQKLFNGMDSFALLAVPFYMFVGEVMNRGGIAKRLMVFSDTLVGHIKGGLGHVNILSSMFFGGISGSAIADTAAIGGLLIPTMEEEGYDPAYSAAVTASSSVIGIIIPPSIPFILYGVTTSTSISRMFIGGIIPGILAGLILMLVTLLTVDKNKVDKNNGQKKRFVIKNVFLSLKDAWAALIIPFIIVVGILAGVFTATEAGVVAAILALLLGLFVFKELKIKDLPQVIFNTSKTTASVLFLCGNASVTAYLLTLAQVPQELAIMFGSLSENPMVIIIVANVLLLLVGFVMDITPAILILGPVLLPVMTNFGVDPIFWGVIMCVNLGIGLITPPVGTVLFVAAGITKIKMEQLVKAIIPFFIGMVGLLLLLIIFPQLITYLPYLLLPVK
ncbi:TRAP transporter large permease [uncultured Sphaerochaeta sp.]|uniref:TRAP transporter large permease n=1 Tax=uncultured Sphaerochaeta sp. TaxID=886478 RepID=UPI0029C9A344|nr:TRAP transporter large permease [uncultured Sphaerochaeta sp.]